MGPQGLEEEPHFAPEWPCLAPRQTPRHRISPVGKMRAREQGQVLIFQCTPLSPCPGHWGHLRGCGWGEARSTAPRARILQGTWVLLTTWRPHQGAQTIADTVLVVLLTPGPLISSTPRPRASSLCRAPWWHLSLFRLPEGHLEASLSPWVCEKAHGCEHLALPQGSSQETVCTETVSLLR